MNTKEKLIIFITIVFVYVLGIFGLHFPQSNLSKIYKNVSPAVVWIGAEIGPNDYHYYDDYELYKQGIKWQGTGFIISSDGLIATAGHIVENTETFQLRFSDGRKGRAKFAYQEDSNYCDAGFIQITWIEPDGFHILECLNPTKVFNFIVGNELPTEPIKKLFYVKLASEIEITEEVIIVGYPWGLQRGSTITQGIVAALNRNVPFFGEKFMIHADSQSWPGNSGSPVFNMNKDVVGILVGGVWGSDGYSLVTPAKLVELALNKYKANKEMKEAE